MACQFLIFYFLTFYFSIFIVVLFLPEFLKTGLPDLLKSMLGKGMQFQAVLDKRPGWCYVKMNLLHLWVKAWKYLPGIE